MDDYKTLWFTRCPVPTATGIAADRGWFSEEFGPEGIEVCSLQDARGRQPAAIHYTHEHPSLIREGGNVPALWAASRGEPTRLIGLTWIEEHQRILTREDTDLSDPARLRELRLAIPVHTIEIDFWRAMALSGFAGALALGGATLDDAELVEVPAGNPRSVDTAPSDGSARSGASAGQVSRQTPDQEWTPGKGQWEAELEALAAGRVDAVYVKGAVAVGTAERLGAKTAIDLDALPDRRLRVNNGTPRPITVHQRLVDERPDIVARFLEVLGKAADWAGENPGELGRILSNETGSPAAGVTAAYRFSDLHADLSDERLELLAQQETFLRNQGFLARPVDVHDWALVLDKTGELV